MTDDERARVVAVAESWLGTKFHHAARVKGAGVDCIQLIAAVYEEAALLPHVEVRADYPPDWFMHRTEEKILERVGRYFEPVLMCAPGDLVLFRLGRAVSHAGIIAPAWPRMIHAMAAQNVQAQDVIRSPRFARAIAGFWTVKPRGGAL